jgi:signal transduction histidine kinase
MFLAASQDEPGRIYSVAPVMATDDTPLAVVEVSRDMSEVESLLDTLRWVLIAAGGLALVAASLASLWLGRQMAHPLHQIESATEVIAGGDFSRRVSVGGDDEIGRLAAGINTMAAELARLEAARSDFIARVSHDLRTPLTAIKGLVVNLQDSAPEGMQASLSTMDEQTDRLIRLVNDLLALARLRRGDLRLVRTEIDLGAVANSVVSLAKEKARRMGVTLTVTLPGSIPPVLGDADRLQQVMVNLLDNALKATPAGGAVGVQVAVQGHEVLFTVTDTGHGLTPDEAAHAFDPAFRGPRGGAGLGLSIAHDLVVAHGGRIWLENRPEGGADAGFALPC